MIGSISNGSLTPGEHWWRARLVPLGSTLAHWRPNGRLVIRWRKAVKMRLKVHNTHRAPAICTATWSCSGCFRHCQTFRLTSDRCCRLSPSRAAAEDVDWRTASWRRPVTIRPTRRRCNVRTTAVYTWPRVYISGANRDFFLDFRFLSNSDLGIGRNRTDFSGKSSEQKSIENWNFKYQWVKNCEYIVNYDWETWLTCWTVCYYLGHTKQMLF